MKKGEKEEKNKLWGVPIFAWAILIAAVILIGIALGTSHQQSSEPLTFDRAINIALVFISFGICFGLVFHGFTIVDARKSVRIGGKEE